VARPPGTKTSERTTRIATITAKVLAEFRVWLAMSPEERLARELICFRGQDTRLPER
jgi:hypothetical protein